MIINDKKDEEQYLSQGWGNMDITITTKDVVALLQGKKVGLDNFGDEYTVTLKMEELK